MNYTKNVWDQLKNTTAGEIQKALTKDGWVLDITRGATQAYISSDGKRVVIHVHPTKTYRPKLLKALIDDTGWNEQDLKRLNLIK